MALKNQFILNIVSTVRDSQYIDRHLIAISEASTKRRETIDDDDLNYSCCRDQRCPHSVSGMSAAESRNGRLYLFILALCLLIAHQVRSLLHAHQLPAELLFLPQFPEYSHGPPGDEKLEVASDNSSIQIQTKDDVAQLAVTALPTNESMPAVLGNNPILFATFSNATMTATILNDDNLKPWRIAAPNVDTTIPIWMEAYVKFHNQSLTDAHQSTRATDKNKYLIFTCHKSCSGTGNRQRAIMATFMVAMLTNRIFLIDVTYPVRLDSILQPHLVRWNWLPPHLNNLNTKQMKLRNKNPPVLDTPSKFVAMDSQQVIRIEANSPINLERQWKTADVKRYLADFGLIRPFMVPGTIYKQIFWTLYRPTQMLTERAVALRKHLGVDTDGFKYIVVHVRTGGGGKGWKDDDRFTTDKPDNLYANAKMVRNSMRKGTIATGTNETFPIVVLSDEKAAKEKLYAKDPVVVRYADTKIIHVDRSKGKDNDLDGSLAVWADMLVMAQSTCIVKGRGSFSMLGVWLASKSFGGGCMQLVI
jgi:hypothetical protein